MKRYRLNVIGGIPMKIEVPLQTRCTRSDPYPKETKHISTNMISERDPYVDGHEHLHRVHVESWVENQSSYSRGSIYARDFTNESNLRSSGRPVIPLR